MALGVMSFLALFPGRKEFLQVFPVVDARTSNRRWGLGGLTGGRRGLNLRSAIQRARPQCMSLPCKSSELGGSVWPKSNTGLGVTASPIHRKVDTDRGHPSGEGHWRSFESSPDQRLYLMLLGCGAQQKLRCHWASMTPRQNKVERKSALTAFSIRLPVVSIIPCAK